MEQQSAHQSIQETKQEIQNIDTKLNFLLDGYLDGTIESEVYKQKKNQLFEEKLRLQDKISQIKDKGSHWLEPMEEFMQSALQAQKYC